MATTNFAFGLDAALALVGGKWKPLIGELRCRLSSRANSHRKRHLVISR
jgi:hypothetical protein